MSWPERLLREPQEVAQDGRLRQLRQRGRARAAQRRRNRREAVADRLGDARLGRGHVEAALARARLLVQEGLVPGGLMEGAQVRRGWHARSYAMAAARASASRSMSSWVCTSVTHTSADWPSASNVRERSSGPWMPAAASTWLTSATVRPVPSRSITNSLKNGAASAGERTPAKLAEALGGVLAALHDRRAELAHPVGPEQREMDGHADRPQALRRAGEVARLAALHVRHAVPAHLAEAPLVVDRAARADQERRVLGHDPLVVGAGDEADRPAAVVHVDAEALELAADEVGAVARRGFEDAERGRVDADDGECAARVRALGDRRRVGLERAEEGGVLEVDAGHVVAQCGIERGEVERPGGRVARHVLDGHASAAGARDDRAPLGREQRGHERSRPAGQAAGHQDRAGRGRAPVVGRLGDDVALDEVADHARELEERLELAVVGVGLAVVRGEELAPPDDLVDDGRHVVRPAAAAQERDAVAGRDVAVEHALDPAAQLQLRADRRLDLEQPPETQPLRDRRVEVVGALDADRLEHLLPDLWRGVGDVRVRACETHSALHPGTWGRRVTPSRGRPFRAGSR